LLSNLDADSIEKKPKIHYTATVMLGCEQIRNKNQICSDISIVFCIVNLVYSNTEHEIHYWQMTNTSRTPAAGVQSSDRISLSCSTWSI